jgi:uncharacterized protein
MELRVDVITLAVPDLDEANRYYVDALGWTPAFQVPGEVTFLWAGTGRLVGLFGRDDLAKDIGIDDPPPFDLGRNCNSPEEVDEVVAAMRDAGATVLKEPQRPAFFDGRHAYVRTPEGTVWEITYNPGFAVDDNGIRQING